MPNCATATEPRPNRKTRRAKTTTPPELAAVAEQLGTFATYQQAAEMLGTSVRTLRRATEAGELPLYRVGRARVLRLRTADVLALVERVA